MSDEKKLSERIKWKAFRLHPADRDSVVVSKATLDRWINEIATLEQRLESMQKRNLRDGKWLDGLGCCRVCNGEIPYGHTSDCDYYKLEKRLAEANDYIRYTADKGTRFLGKHEEAVSFAMQENIHD